MARSYHVYTATAAQKYFVFNKPYIAQAHVMVIVDGVLKVETTDYTWENNQLVRFNSGLVGGELVELVRKTPTDILVNFINSAVFADADLNIVYRQALYILEELLDDSDRSIKLPRGTFEASAADETTLAQFVGNVYTDANAPPNIVQDTFDLKLAIATAITAAGDTVVDVTLSKENTATSTVIEGAICG